MILDLAERAERFAQALQAHSPEFVLCHSDVHAGNILIDPGGAFYIVDWDDPLLAPKERDLMFAGGGQFGDRRTPMTEKNYSTEGMVERRSTQSHWRIIAMSESFRTLRSSASKYSRQRETAKIENNPCDI